MEVHKMIVDNNMHWMPETMFTDEALLEEILRIPPRSEECFAEKTTIPGTDKVQIILEQPKGYQNVNYTESDADAEKRIKTMDEIGIDKAILRVPVIEEWLNLEMSRKFNDLMYETVQKNPDRLKPVAIVPPWGDKACLYELERCVKELGCVAVEMSAHYGSMHLDEEVFRPHWRKINELGIPAIIHHTPLPAAYQSLYQTGSRRMLGRCFAQMTCLARLVHSGLYDELPDQKVIHSYMGGGFFAFTEIMNMNPANKQKEEMQRVHHGVTGEKFERYLRNNIYLDMCHASPWGKRHMEFAIEVMGADHILFGTSYPIRFEWAYDGVPFIQSLDISEEEKALVLGGNAERLFKLS
jgi:predicted TIM-barrel fold metal-dependent hydrolase